MFDNRGVLANFMSDYLIHRRVMLKGHHVPTGKTRHTEGCLTSDGLVPGPELPAPSQLVIAQLRPDEGYYLLHLDNQGNEITDTYHGNLEDALGQAKWEFEIEVDEWELP